MVFKQIQSEANYVVDTSVDLMNDSPISTRIFHMTHSLVDDQTRLDRRFLISNPATTISLKLIFQTNENLKILNI